MLTILRKIRRSLIDSGSVRKYLFYSIGEIALVVIGILIALQINDWNSERVNRNLEKQYLNRLLTDIRNDAEVIEFNLNGINKKKEDLRKVRALLDGEVQADQDELRVLLSASDNFYNLKEDRLIATFQELLSTGNLQLIRNVSLRDKIVLYYSRWDQQMVRVNERRAIFGKQLIHQLIDEDDFFKGDPLIKIDTLPDFLEENNLLNQFQMEFNHEVNYALHAEKMLVLMQTGNQEITQRITEELESL